MILLYLILSYMPTERDEGQPKVLLVIKYYGLYGGVEPLFPSVSADVNTGRKIEIDSRNGWQRTNSNTSLHFSTEHSTSHITRFVFAYSGAIVNNKSRAMALLVVLK